MNTDIQQIAFIGLRISKARQKLHLSKVGLAEKMHLSRSIIGKWEKGISNPSTAHLIKLSKVLKVSFNWLATGTEENSTISSANESETLLKINQLLAKTTLKQKQYICELLEDITQ
jgi:transcriptional regulator with XRE-family HTH domain